MNMQRIFVAIVATAVFLTAASASAMEEKAPAKHGKMMLRCDPLSQVKMLDDLKGALAQATTDADAKDTARLAADIAKVQQLTADKIAVQQKMMNEHMDWMRQNMCDRMQTMQDMMSEMSQMNTMTGAKDMSRKMDEMRDQIKKLDKDMAQKGITGGMAMKDAKKDMGTMGMMECMSDMKDKMSMRDTCSPMAQIKMLNEITDCLAKAKTENDAGRPEKASDEIAKAQNILAERTVKIQENTLDQLESMNKNMKDHMQAMQDMMDDMSKMHMMIGNKEMPNKKDDGMANQPAPGTTQGTGKMGTGMMQ